MHDPISKIVATSALSTLYFSPNFAAIDPVIKMEIVLITIAQLIRKTRKKIAIRAWRACELLFSACSRIYSRPPLWEMIFDKPAKNMTKINI